MNMSDNHKEQGNWNIRICVICAIVLLVCGIALTLYDFSETSSHSDWNNPGIRGDFYGGHLSAASALAGTLLLFSAVLMQSKELKLQRIELSESRKVATEQARALEEQVEVLQKQNTIVRRRNDYELIISLTEKTNNQLRINTNTANVLCRLTMARIVDCAATDQNMAYDLLNVFVSSVCSGPINMDRSYINDVLNQAVNNYAPELKESTQNIYNRKWLDMAISTIHCA